MTDETHYFEDKVTDLDWEYHDLYDMREYANDIEFIRISLKTLNIHTSHLICYHFWSWWSHELDAGWLVVTTEEIHKTYRNMMKNY